VVDRCATCHVALKEASLNGRDDPAVPAAPVCASHADGNSDAPCAIAGRAPPPACRKPTAAPLPGSSRSFPPANMNADNEPAGQCHWNSLTGTPQLNLGRKLLARYGCVSATRFWCLARAE